MQARSQVTVAIVSYNTRDLTLECIRSVIESASEQGIEIVVVDNASNDKSSEAIRSAFPQVIVVANEINVGFGAACNQIIRQTDSPFILLLNSDARIDREAFRALCRVMLSRRACGAAGCRVLDGDGKQTIRARNFLTPFNHALELLGIKSRLARGYLRRTHHLQLDDELLDCSVDWIDGSCLMLRRAALDEAGLFDTRFFMYSEDEDLCKRLKDRGWTICYTATGAAIHHGAKSSSQNRLQMLGQFYLSQMMFLFKHRGRLSVFFYALMMRLAIALKRSLKKSRRDEMSEHLAAFKQAYRSKDWQRL